VGLNGFLASLVLLIEVSYILLLISYLLIKVGNGVLFSGNLLF